MSPPKSPARSPPMTIKNTPTNTPTITPSKSPAITLLESVDDHNVTANITIDVEKLYKSVTDYGENEKRYIIFYKFVHYVIDLDLI